MQAYMRKFVILNEQRINYLKTNNQKPKGHVKIEVRDGNGKIILNVDGLNPDITDEKIYKGYLLSNDNLKLVKVDIGSIIVNSSGRGSVEWEFNPLSVGGTSKSIDSFNVILVKLCLKNKYDEEMVIPLAGYIYDDDGSISTIISKLGKDIKHENKLESKNYHKEKEEVETHEELKPIEVFEIEEFNELQKNEPEENLDVHEAKEAKEAEEVVQEQEAEEVEEVEEVEELVQQDDLKSGTNPSFKYNYNLYNDNNYGNSINKSNTYIENARNYSKQIANYTMNILKFFDKVEPLREALKGYKWWEIEYDSKNIYRGFLPFYNYLVNMYYQYPFMTKITTCQGLIKKHNHYIFGILEEQDEIQYYVYGVPGRFTREDQPYNGATGFTTWLKNKERSREDMGYWLIYIDALSGKIVTPLNPSTPPN